MTELLGGAGGGGGGGAPAPARTPRTAKDTLQSVSIVEFIDGITEGEIEGFATTDPLESVYLNDTPIKNGAQLNFQGVTLDYRTGTQAQTYIPGQNMSSDEDAGAAIEFSVNTEIALAAPVVRTISSTLADACRITVKVNALWSRNPSNGDVNGTSVSINIEVKPSGGTFALVSLDGRDTIRGKASSSYERSYHIPLNQFGSAPYDIRITRLTSEDSSGNVANTIFWESYTELMYSKLRYPNTALARLTLDARHFQSIPRRGFLLKGIKVRVPGPAFYDPVLRTYTGTDWDGTFVTAWTRCPAWIFYDIITDPRYGLGKTVNAQYIDKWNLWTIAKRCDELINDGFGGTEPRYSMDLYLQQAKDAKTVIQDMASNFDTMSFWHSGGIYTTQDAPKTVTSLYVPANVIGGRFNYAGSGRQTRYTVALVQWNDPDDFYRIATEYVEDPSGIDRYGYVEKKMVAIGCTSRGQAHRSGKRVLLTSRLETDTVTFSVGLDGLVNKPGDIIRVSDPLRHNNIRYAGRVSTSSTTTSIELDQPVDLLSGQAYTVTLVDSSGNVITAPVTNAAGTTQTLTTFPVMAEAPIQGAVWSLLSGALPSKEYRILWINENTGDDGEGFYEISAVVYSPEKYTQTEDIGALQPIYQKPYANTNSVIPPTALTVTDGVYLGAEGITRYIDISWTASNDPLIAHHIVKWSLDDGEETEVSVVGSAYRIENAKEGTYTIELFAVNIARMVSTSVTVNHVLGLYYAINAVSITHLSVKGTGGGEFEFTGRNAEFNWDTDADTVLNLSDSYSQGIGGQTPWFRDFVISIGDGFHIYRTDYTTESAYVYTYEKNVEDGGPRRNITISVHARDFYGNVSQNQTLAVINPPPITFGNITVTAGVEQIFVEYFPPADPDYRYTRVYASQLSGFTPDGTPGTGNLVFEGTDRVMSFPVAVEGTWYIKLQGIDEFGPSGATFSSQISVVVAATDVTDAVDAILADPGRNGDMVVETTRFIIVHPSTHATPTAVFAVGSVDGQTKVGVRGDLLIDGSILARSIAASTITADKMLVTQLSAIAADMGTVTAGTFKTSPVETGWRTEISDVGTYPIWYGTGTKNSTNAKFYLDNAGNAFFSGELSAATGTFQGSMTAGSIDINSGAFSVNSSGAVVAKNITVEDVSGNTILSSGNGTEWQYVSGAGKPADNADITFNQLGGSGVNVANAEYSLLEEAPLPAGLVAVNGTLSLDNTVSYFGGSSLKHTATASDSYVYLGGNATDYNVKIVPNKRWIFSCYVRCDSANESGQFLVIGPSFTKSVWWTAAPAALDWILVSATFDLTLESDTNVILRLDNNTSTVTMWYDGIMFEEKIGGLDTPSSYSIPAGFTGENGDYATLSGLPTSLSNINGTEGSKLTAIENNATAGATWGSNISSQPGDSELLNSQAIITSNLAPGFEAWTNTGSNWVYTNQPEAVNNSSLVIPDGSNNMSSSVGIRQLWDGATYTISFKAKGNGSRVLHVDLFPDTLPENTLTPPSSFQLYSFTNTADLSSSSTLRFFAEADPGQIEIIDVQLELGSIRSAWSPHKTDLVGVSNKVSASNISTYMENAAIDTVYIKDAAIDSTKILYASIATSHMIDASVETLKIKGSAVTEQVSALYAPAYTLGTLDVTFNFNSADINYLLLFISFEDQQDSGGANATIYVDLKQDSTVLKTYNGQTLGPGFIKSNHVYLVESPPATANYTLHARKSGTGFAQVQNLLLVGMGSKR